MAKPRPHGDGPIKTFALRGVKDNPPYLHDERLLTLEDTVEFFNLILSTKLTPPPSHHANIRTQIPEPRLNDYCRCGKDGSYRFR
jgi:hypothetical protein